MIDQKILKELFTYRDGLLIRKVRTSSCIHVGDVSGTTAKDGYMRVSIDGFPRLYHRMIFLHQKGYLPRFLDHIDRDPTNNRIENLRECNMNENYCNRGKQANNTTGYKGVYWKKDKRKFKAQISFEKVEYFLGYFDNKIDAAKAYDNKAIELHGKFAYLNFPQESVNA